jgi:S-DNA-T family DNA segregation ATPase FtsK/SpoIIIE
LILDISADRLKESGSGIFAIIVLSVLFGFATSVPELGGTVGYELNLFLQDYRKNRDTLDFDFCLIIYVIF